MRVVAAVIQRDQRFLLGRRPEPKRHGGLWEFPGGKMRPGESLLEAARRELGEELELEVLGIGAGLLVVPDPGSEFEIEFVEVEVAGEPHAREHEKVGWFGLEQLAGLALAPADERFVDHLLEARSGQASRNLNRS